MRVMRSPWFWGLGVVAALAGCDEGARSPDFLPELDSIQVCAKPLNQECPADGSVGCPTANAIVPAGREQQFCALGFYSGFSNDEVTIPRTSRDITTEANWSSSLTAVATIDDDGLATAQEEGQTQITASVGSVDGSTQLRVTEAQLESLDIQPASAQLVPGEQRPFQCFGTFSGERCEAANQASRVCDVTEETQWTSSRASVATVGNLPSDVAEEPEDAKGVVSAQAPGTTTVRCSASGDLESVPPASATVRVCNAELDPDQPFELRIAGAPTDGLTLQVNQTVQLQLIGRFIVDDANCTAGEGNLRLVDLTNSAEWSSDRPEVARVGNRVIAGPQLDPNARGAVTGVSPGLATVSAEYEGRAIGLPVIVRDDEVLDVTVTGPDFLFAPGSYQYQAFARYEVGEGASDPDALPEGCEPVEPAEGETSSEVLCDVTESIDTLWRAEASTGGSAAPEVTVPANNGRVVVTPDAQPQTVRIVANFRGIVGSKESVILPARLVDVRVTPSLACISSGTLGLGSVTNQQYTAQHVYEIDVPGQDTPLTCGIDGSEASLWGIPVDSFVGLTENGSDLLSLLQIIPMLGDFFAGCNPILPVGTTEGPTPLATAPAFVSNQAGERGLVRPNTRDVLGVIPNLTVGTACVTATATNSEGTDLTGQGTVLVAIDGLPEVCSALSPLTEALLADGPEETPCSEALANITLPEEGEGEGDGSGGGEGEGSALGGLLDFLLGGAGR